MDNNTIEEIKKALEKAKLDITDKITSIEKKNIDYNKPVVFDIGVNSFLLEADQVEEVKAFYELSNPNEHTLLLGKILLVILGQSKLISEDLEVTWGNIKSYFREQMNDNICNLSYIK